MVQEPVIRPVALALVLAGCAARGTQPARSDDDVLELRVDSRGNQTAEVLDSARVDSLRGAGIFVETRVDQRPVLLMMPELKYPEDLRIMGAQGRVMFRCIIGRDGRVEPRSIRLISADDAGFVYNARLALLGARFRPAKVHGQSVRTLVNVPFDFKIRGAHP